MFALATDETHLRFLDQRLTLVEPGTVVSWLAMINCQSNKRLRWGWLQWIKVFISSPLVVFEPARCRSAHTMRAYNQVQGAKRHPALASVLWIEQCITGFLGNPYAKYRLSAMSTVHLAQNLKTPLASFHCRFMWPFRSLVLCACTRYSDQLT